ncbi:MAG: nicotinate-nucleotide--dimethylbenzimidazole phosphoribosyltransferase [Eubacteriales bacterium]|jgi:nicotinate-nucleotide--dimethylbenzimidazole phosphoribosyltransferase
MRQALPPDQAMYTRVRRNWDHIAKPLDSMGTFEKMHARVASIQENENPDFSHAALLVMCGDHGVVAEGVSQSDQSVTAICAQNIGRGVTTAGVLARAAGADVLAVDVGINHESADHHLPFVLDQNVRCGTRDFLKEPALTEEEVLRAIQTGIDLAGECRDRGIMLLAIGEMGIGNTTSASAMAAAMLGLTAEQVTGRGAGLSDAGLARKTEVIREGLEKYGYGAQVSAARKRPVTSSDPDTAPCAELTARAAGQSADAGRIRDTLRVMMCFGGLELAAMTGLCIGGAVFRVPVVLDGVLSEVSAFTAERLFPGVRDFLVSSHMSREPVAGIIEKRLGLMPVLSADMATGEGAGAAMMLSLLQLVGKVYREALKFGESHVEQYRRYKKADE